MAGFAVVDLETTGLYPARDRVVEVAILLLEADASVTHEFETLVNPKRDVGPTRIHGITATDVVDAPVFSDVAAELWTWLEGRVLVAHNARFDLRFLDREFGRCGARLPPPPVMCTMQLARHYLVDLPGRSLVSCCKAAGVPLSHHHSAVHDARAAAGLFARYRAAHRGLPGSWQQALVEAATATWAPRPPSSGFHLVTRDQSRLRRAQEKQPLAKLVDRLPRGATGDADAYLSALDRVLEDRLVSDGEAADLRSLAAELGLTQESAMEAHRRYLRHVAAAAWSDGVVTDAERADLLAVAGLLGVPSDEALRILGGARQGESKPEAFPRVQRLINQRSTLTAGDRVVFTGQTHLPREQLEAMASRAGLRVMKSVSGKTAMLVAADPCSQSGKAKTARERGVRVVTEQVFLYLLDRMDIVGDQSVGRDPSQECSSDAVAKPTADVAAGWYRDATDAALERWWDGRAWTQYVRPSRTPNPGWYPDPGGQPYWRWWDGIAWTAQVR